MDLWVADYAANTIGHYYCDPHETTYITNGVNQPVALAFDDFKGFLWAANAGANNVTAYNAITNDGPIVTVPTGDLQPTALLSHGSDLYIAAFGAKGSKVFDYNVKTGTQTEVTDGVNAPAALAWCEPNLCVMNAFSITIYDSSNKLVNTIKIKQTPISLSAVPAH
ncbi:MAG: hypothetical protein JO146_02740 [Candidatus Eremiobacteraeota bacterium]|nr:hypothetical protein [Candidatus Eremiobacteraeota bacterium]